MRATSVRLCRRLAFGLAVGLAGAPGCKPTVTTPPAPTPPAPALQVKYVLQEPADFAAARDDALAAMAWLVRVAPQDTDPGTWKKARDLALDWLEGVPEPRITPAFPIVSFVEDDERFAYTPYVRMAYLCGKAHFVLTHDGAGATPSADSVEAELAGVDGMLDFYAATQASSRPSTSRRLERLGNKKRKGKLRAWVADHLGRSS